MESFCPHTREKFPLIRIQGDARQLGLSHGRQLARRIRRCWRGYRELIGAPDEDIRAIVDRSAAAVRRVYPQYAIEIEAIAEGAGLPAWQIYALNARTELILHFDAARASECTAVYDRRSGLLGQTWDWMPALERLAVLMQIDHADGHSILMMSEPGIIGKIGLNSFGVAVILTILECEREIGGVPVHVLLRRVLDSSSAGRAAREVWSADSQTMSSMLIADSSGASKGIEIAGSERGSFCENCERAMHTNHYLALDFDSSDPIFSSSRTRLARARALLQEHDTLELPVMKRILLDRENGREAICHEFVEDETISVEGTICCLVMDVHAKTLHATPGSPFVHGFEEYHLKHPAAGKPAAALPDALAS